MPDSDPPDCPQWLTSMLEEVLADHPDWPGVQLTLSSPHCGLNCTASAQSSLSKFANEPPLLDDTPWRLASVTKTFTAVAILKLAEDSMLDLYAPAIPYLPSWAVKLLEESQGAVDARKITTWQLLHHTSGLGSFANEPRFMQEILSKPQHMWSARSILECPALHSAPVGKPGEIFYYSDTGYTLLGLILETITGKDLATAVRDLTKLDELDMPSTWWEILEPEPKNALRRAGQYYKDTDMTDFNASFDLYGAGGLVTNSKDLNTFGRALHEGRLLNEASMQLLYTFESSGTYGCGILKYDFAGQRAWGHTGFWKTWLYWVPSLDLVISGASNQASSDMFDAAKLVQAIIDHGGKSLVA